MKADKIWLLVNADPEKEKASSYIKSIKKEFIKLGIKTESTGSDRRDVFNVLKTVKEIFEKEKNNDIYVNVSAGSKIQAIGCMMACMMFKEYEPTPYYAEPKAYPATKGKPQSSGLRNLVELPKYEIKRPKPEIVKALKIIKDNGGKIRKKNLAILAEQNNLIKVTAREENLSQARFASLDKNIVQPLSEQWKFVEIEKIGKNRWVKLTHDGNNAAEFLI